MGENTHPVVPTPFAPLSCASILSLHINVSTSQILIHPRTEPDTIYISSGLKQQVFILDLGPSNILIFPVSRSHNRTVSSDDAEHRYLELLENEQHLTDPV